MYLFVCVVVGGSFTHLVIFEIKIFIFYFCSLCSFLVLLVQFKSGYKHTEKELPLFLQILDTDK